MPEESKDISLAGSDELTVASRNETATMANQPQRLVSGSKFWLILISNLLVDLLSALDLTAVSTALPTIVDDLHGSDFIWAGSAYTIASTAVLPLIGGLVSSFGRKPILLGFILCFAAGSAVTGAAQSMNMLIAGRVVQGFGGGGCLSVAEIVCADMIPLPERGKFQGITAAVWAAACAIGPPIGGALARAGAWRWLFFLNLPLCGVAMISNYVFLQVHTPKESFKDKVKQMDWTGHAFVIGSTVSLMLALTWGGIQYAKMSPQVLIPLVIGTVGLLAFFAIEYLRPQEQTIPRFFFTNRTTFSGYAGTFFHGISALTAIYYLPVYFQAVHGASGAAAGVDMFGLSFTIPIFSIVCGVSVPVLRIYRPQNYTGWALIIVGFGVLSLLDERSTRAQYIGCQVPLGMGLGIVWLSTQFAILAPLPVSNNAHAIAFYTFTRCFAQSWGVVIGGTILQNTLVRDLPLSFVDTLPRGVQIAYAAIPALDDLVEPLKTDVRIAFARSTRLIWLAMVGVGGAGLLSCLLMREVPMRTDMDETWAVTDPGRAGEEVLSGAMDVGSGDRTMEMFGRAQ